ncbi:TPA: hypothetical protein HA317_02775 [Candidatus Woesearchaeota archaeon]|nr:hypothetical protein [Candidatus Woesearchaeota archaeon]
MRSTTKNGQVEIIGLVVIVMVLIVAGYFGIRLMISSPRQRNEYANIQLATNFVNALLRTSTDCKATVGELFSDCASFEDIHCDGKSSCEKAEEVSREILASTLREWDKGYSFIVETAGRERVIDQNMPCDENAMPGVFPLSTRSGKSLVVKLVVCD